ncbi:AAA family ATPase [Nonomuraea lactucae]|uniref:AAA family ATPase n=1 Tax=Nonomuraea lactucae TaxID=2249762 RepID=UPI000DE24723|nr:AAA family ATPase [Nonomuraea lactucae]
MTTEQDSKLWDLGAEQAVLGTCMTVQYIVPHIRTALPDPEAFYRPAHRTIYQAILDLHDADAPTDAVILGDKLQRESTLDKIDGGLLYLHELMAAAPLAGDPAFHAGIVARHANTRRSLAALTRGIQWVTNAAATDNIHDALTAVQEEISKALGDIAGSNTNAANALAGLYTPIDWTAAFSSQPEEIPWLVENLIEQGRSIAIYSPPKAGKSLFTLEIAAALATGRPVLSQPAQPPARILYIDIENSQADIVERLTNLGYGPADLELLQTNLVYFSFPSLPVLDSAAGGQHLLALAKAHQPALVVIDTVSRVIEGSENDADTFANLYRHALAPLKGMGVSVIRLDHSGKDLEKGQRGSSAKGADVDAVWLLVKVSETSLYLKREMSRANHGVPLIELRRRADPLRHELAVGGSGLPPKVTALIDKLDGLQVPLDAGRDAIRDELALAGFKASNETISAAIAARRAGLR